ncbi:hypothetical protein BS78_01G372800 [Paspalum vaginatum]|nr:hypothetical protein BS78_01G372800 [Paspalum vaginatum]
MRLPRPRRGCLSSGPACSPSRSLHLEEQHGDARPLVSSGFPEGGFGSSCTGFGWRSSRSCHLEQEDHWTSFVVSPEGDVLIESERGGGACQDARGGALGVTNARAPNAAP